jgi:hypothetical protein
MSRRFWTDAERDQLRTLYPDHSAAECAEAIGRTLRSVIDQVKALGLRKSREWIAERARQRTLESGHGGRRGQFQPGLVPWNKGRSFEAGGRSPATRFRSGQFSGRARELYKPIGTLRINTFGVLERKVTDDHPVPARRWVGEHRLVWEAEHGPIPPRHVVRFLPGMHTTDAAEITVDRLEMISQAENMRRNTIHNWPPEFVELTHLRGVLNRHINRIEKEAK